MKTLRYQFEAQCTRAQSTAAFYGIVLDIVLVRHRNKDPSRISILGNAINRQMADVWRADGSQVRLLCSFDPSGNLVKPTRKTNETL